MPEELEQNKVDFRSYIGIIFFRWQIIVMCFLYALLGGVLYINLSPKTYLTACKIMIYRESNLEVAQPINAAQSGFSSHIYMLQSGIIRGEVVRDLWEKWADKMGGRSTMMLGVNVAQDRQIGSTLNVSVNSSEPTYAEDFLRGLIEKHQQEWEKIQETAANKVSKMLEDELLNIEEKIKTAEDDQIEYQRLKDIPRVEAKSTMESRYLTALMERKSMLITELLLLEAEHPALKDANVAVISDVASLTRETGAVEATQEAEQRGKGEGYSGEDGESDQAFGAKPKLPFSLSTKVEAKKDSRSDDVGWQDLRVNLAKLEQKEKDLEAKFKPEHPELLAVRKEIESTKNELETAAQIEKGRLADRHKALTIALNALESAEYNWKAKSLLASQRRAELKRLAGIVDRYDNNYRTLYSRLQDMRISEELKAEHFRLVEPVSTNPTPTWPDPLKILFVAVVAGMGAGLGLTTLLQLFDNKVQTIRDVEKELGIPFLGGIPYWADSGLDRGIRPIVIEDSSMGAVEAYRSLRTPLISALAKQNEKIVFFTSADSKEGKSLTALNLAVMISQMDKKVLLVDMDLRRGRLHRCFGLEKEPGFSNVMRDDLPIRSAIAQTKFPNLWLMPAGQMVDNSAELFQTSDVKRLLDDIKDEYDYILIDTSPVLRVTDTVILSTLKLGVFLLIAHVNRAPKPMVRYALNLLKDAHILGIIMNSIELHKIGSLYYAYQYPNYAYYSNAYRYGYDYHDHGDGKSHRAGKRKSWDKKGRTIGEWVRGMFFPIK